jgi:hypothetical protein
MAFGNYLEAPNPIQRAGDDLAYDCRNIGSGCGGFQK